MSGTETKDSMDVIQTEENGSDSNGQGEQDNNPSQKMVGRLFRVQDKDDGQPTFKNICPICQNVCHSLPEHFKFNHKGRDWRGIETPCPFENCDKVLVDIQNHITKIHLKSEKNFGCDLCDAKFRDRFRVKHHMNTVHSTLREKCAQCDTMLKVGTMKMHIKNVHEKVGTRVACTEKDCQKTFGTKSDMERHVRTIHLDVKAPCPDCGKRFGVNELASHIKVVHQKIYPLKCQQCDKGFQWQRHLQIHINTKHNGNFAVCEMPNARGETCGKKLSSEEGLRKHIQKIHLKIEDDTKVPCPECGALLFQESLQRHIKQVHLKIDQKVCTFENCGQIFVNKYSLQKHVDTIHNKVINREWCDICEEFKNNLKAHIRLVHMDCEMVPCTWPECSYQAKTRYLVQKHIQNIHEDKPRVKCEECGKSVRDLYSHIKTIHKRVDSYFCDECDKGFPNKYQLKDHISKIHNKLRTTCPDCGVEVAAGYLATHKRFVHEKKRAAACDVPGCDTTFVSHAAKKEHVEKVHEKKRDSCPECGQQVSNVKSHIRIVHRKERNYECQECLKTYKVKSHLKNHIKTFHLGVRVKCEDCGEMVTDIYAHRHYKHREKNYPCDQCGTNFSSSTSLKMHILSVHMGAKEHCEICDKDFAVTSFKVHMKTHMTEEEKKPHPCPQCDKIFGDTISLKKHVNRVHLSITEECPRCGLETKDLYRHMKYTNCERETYIPRRKKIKKIGRGPGRNRKTIHSYFPDGRIPESLASIKSNQSYFPASLASDQASLEKKNDSEEMLEEEQDFMKSKSIAGEIGILLV